MERNLAKIEALQRRGGLMTREEKELADALLIQTCLMAETPPESELELDSRCAIYWHDRAKAAEALLARSDRDARNWSLACGAAVSLLLTAGIVTAWFVG